MVTCDLRRHRAPHDVTEMWNVQLFGAQGSFVRIDNMKHSYSYH